MYEGAYHNKKKKYAHKPVDQMCIRAKYTQKLIRVYKLNASMYCDCKSLYYLPSYRVANNQDPLKG